MNVRAFYFWLGIAVFCFVCGKRVLFFSFGVVGIKVEKYLENVSPKWKSHQRRVHWKLDGKPWKTKHAQIWLTVLECWIHTRWGPKLDGMWRWTCFIGNVTGGNVMGRHQSKQNKRTTLTCNFVIAAAVEIANALSLTVADLRKHKGLTMFYIVSQSICRCTQWFCVVKRNAIIQLSHICCGQTASFNPSPTCIALLRSIEFNVQIWNGHMLDTLWHVCFSVFFSRSIDSIK